MSTAIDAMRKEDIREVSCPLPSQQELIGSSEPMKRLRDHIARVAALNIPVLIQGPTGSGKELVAQALHLMSRRRGALVSVNVSAIAEPMFEDAMFGHARGAFTGATGDRIGYIAEAHRGSLFLDEISSLSISAQAKVLRALETKNFRPVGGVRDESSDFRLLTATNLDLDGMVRRGLFREDLAERLECVVIEVPSLAARREDIPALLTHFAANATRSTGRSVRFAADALQVLQSYHWPRNVRELRNVVERAIALHDGPVLDGGSIRTALHRPFLSPTAMNAGLDTERSPAARSMMDLLEEYDWDTRLVATALDVNRATVYRRMHRCGLLPRPRARSNRDDPQTPAC